MTIIDWPVGLPLFDATDFSLTGSTPSSGQALDGREQLVWRENRVWQARLTLAALRGTQVLILRAFADQIRGRYGKFRVPICNRHTTRYFGDPNAFWAGIGITPTEISEGFTRYSDGTTFSDGTGFALPDYGDPVFRSAAPVGATRVFLDGYLGRHVSVGAHFTVNGFLYRVASNSDGDLRINPPLREAVTVGTTALINNPSVVVRLQSADGLRVTENHNRITPPISFDVIEAFDR